MKGHTPTDIEPRLTRRAELRRSLEERRSELVAKLHERMRTMRAEHEIREIQGGLDDGEVSEVDIQEDITLALIKRRTETLSRIDESIARLEAGVYGQCSSCGEEIATSRLRALPFAVRCRECEEHQETERRRARIDRGRAHPFFMDRNGLRDSALS
jgi:RNA polymerase-binding transcription factor